MQNSDGASGQREKKGEGERPELQGKCGQQQNRVTHQRTYHQSVMHIPAAPNSNMLSFSRSVFSDVDKVDKMNLVTTISMDCSISQTMTKEKTSSIT